MKIRLKEYEVGEGTYYRKCRAYLDTETGNIDRFILPFQSIKEIKCNIIIKPSYKY